MARPDQQSRSTQAGIINVLHLDDEANQLEFTKTFLESVEPTLNVESILSPKEALQRLDEKSFDCIVTDYKMPGMNGIEFAAKVREDSDIPIVIYTGQGSEEVAEAAFAVGVDDYLRKEMDPSHYQVLARSVKSAVEKHWAEKLYSEVVTSSTDGITIFDGTKIVFANQITADNLGVDDPQDLIGTDALDWIVEEDREVIMSHPVTRGESNDAVDFTFRVNRQDGEIRSIESTNVPVTYRGRPAILVFGRDVTDRMRMEGELRESEARYRYLVDNASEAILVSQDGHYKFANQRVEEISGYTVEEFLSLTTPDIVHPDDLEYVAETFKKIELARSRGETIDDSLPFRIKTKDGETRWVDLKSIPIIWEGRLAGLNFHTDVTERLRVEKENADYRDKLQALHAHASELNSKETLIEIAETTYDTIKQVFGFNYGSFGIVKDDHILHFLVAGVEDSDEFIQPLDGPGLCVRAVKTGESQLVNDVGKDPDHMRGPSTGTYESLSELVVPVIIDDNVVAVFLVQSLSLNAFTENDRKLMETFAEHVSSAISQLRARESLRYNAKLLETVSDAVFSVNTDNEIVSWNKAAEEIYGWTAAEAIGKNVVEITNPVVESLSAEELFQQLWETGSWSGNRTHMRKNGERFEVYGSINRITDSAGNTLGAVSVNRDITFRQQMEKALMESEEKFRALLEESRDAIFVLDHERYLYANSKGAELLGLSDPSELIGRGAFEFIAREDREKVREIAVKRQKGEAVPSRYEFNIVNMDGKRIPVETNVSLIEYDGKPASLAINRDITEQKRMEEELRRSEEKYRTLLEEGMDGVSISVDREYVYVNNTLVELLGYSDASELIGRKSSETVDPRDAEFLDEIAQRRKNGETQRLVYQLRCLKKDGSSIWVEVSSLGIEFEGKQAAIGNTREITERKRMEEALIGSEERFRKLFEEAPIGVSLIDKEGHNIMSNRVLSEMLGYSEEEFRAMTFKEYSHPDDVDVSWKYFNELINGERDSYGLEKRYIHKDGHEIWTKILVSSTRDVEGEPQYFIGMSEDITDRKRAELALEESEERLRRFMDSSPEGFAILDDELNYVDVNEALMRRSELSKEDYVGKNIVELFPDIHETGRYEKYMKVIETGEPFNTEILISRFGERRLRVDAFKMPEGMGIISTDITEATEVQDALRESEERLRESESMYRELADNSLDVIYKVDLEGNIAYASPAVENLTGYSVEELAGESFYKLLPKENLPQIANAIQEAIEGTHIQWFQTDLFRKDGTRLTVEINSSQLKEHDTLVGFQGIIRDITERKKVETALQESEERWRSLVELAPDGILTVDLKGFVTSINDAFENLTGFSRDEIVGKHFTRLSTMRARDIPTYVKLFAALVKGDIPSSYEFIFKRKDGSEGWAEAQLRLIETDKKKRELLAVVRDVSERKRMEDLRVNNELNRRLVEELDEKLKDVEYKQLWSVYSQSTVPTLILGKDGKIVDYNAAMFQLTGYNHDEVPDTNSWMLKLYPDEDYRNETIETSTKSRNREIDVKRDVFTITRKDGEKRHIEFSVYDIFHDGEPTDLQVVQGVDITQQTQLEDKVIEAERIAAAGRIASMVGHDLRGPLQTIKNSLFLMEISPDRTEEFKKIANDAIDYAVDILEDLRFNTRDITPNKQDSNLDYLVEKAVSEASVPENVNVQLDIKDGLKSVSIDPTQIRRVLDNLIRNAVEAMPEGGELKVKCELRGDNVTLSVSDTGVGIPEDEKEKLFTPFHTTKPQGMGLGLVFCRRAVEAHGGSIEVDSTADVGTKFTVKLPLKQGP